MKTLAKLFKDESGASAIEYVLIAAVIGLGLITAFTGVGARLGTALTNVLDQVDTVTTTPTP